MKSNILVYFVFGLFLISSCGPSDEEKARVKMDAVKAFLTDHDSTRALILLDSIPRLFPGAAYTINAAKNLKNELILSMIKAKLNEMEAVKKRIAELETRFTREKADYDRYARYIHKRQNFDNSWDRSYLRVNLDEQGEISLTSNYYGNQWLDHTAIRVYDQGDQVITGTVPLGSVDNHHSSFMETRWEQVTFRDENSNGIIAFIARNADRKLKAVYIGKRYYYIVLEDYDKEAIKDALLLSETIKNKKKLESRIRSLQAGINIQ